MQFSTSTLMALAASLVAVSASVSYNSNLPDGHYTQKIYPDGTRITEKTTVGSQDISNLDISKRSTIIPSAKFVKRQSIPCGLFPGAGDCDTSCDGELNLDHAGIDQDYINMKAACPYRITTHDHNSAELWIMNGVMTYLCTDGHYGDNTFTADMVQTALERMDAKCDSYESSWYIFPNSNAIIGKTRAGDSICQNASWGSK